MWRFLDRVRRHLLERPLARLLARLLLQLRSPERVRLLDRLRPPEQAAHRAISTDQALARIVRRGLSLNAVIDVGASNGSWSRVCMQHFPKAEYLLVEAQACHQPELEAFCAHHPNTRYIMAAAGNRDGECFFDDSDPFGGLASNEATTACVTRLPMVSLDTVVVRGGIAGPYLLKLDTHGFELPIIEGAEQLLRDTELAVIETYLFRLNETALLFHEFCAQMDRRGFQVADFSEPLWREHDGALWQWDLFFVKKSNPVFRHARFR